MIDMHNVKTKTHVFIIFKYLRRHFHDLRIDSFRLSACALAFKRVFAFSDYFHHQFDVATIKWIISYIIGGN